ncbi:MAG: hypothetical protein JO006_03700 [Paucibacter sp.]|nr:hypothetical protein [Roseateles sp.]
MRRHLEFAVVVLVFSVLFIQLLRALDTMAEAADEADFQIEVSTLRTQLLEIVVHHEMIGGSLPTSANPMAWIQGMPLRHYAGELDAIPAARSLWYFDYRSQLLVYRFRDGHTARFRLTRQAGPGDRPGALAGVGLQRLADESS